MQDSSESALVGSPAGQRDKESKFRKGPPPRLGHTKPRDIDNQMSRFSSPRNPYNANQNNLGINTNVVIPEMSITPSSTEMGMDKIAKAMRAYAPRAYQQQKQLLMYQIQMTSARMVVNESHRSQ